VDLERILAERLRISLMPSRDSFFGASSNASEAWRAASSCWRIHEASTSAFVSSYTTSCSR
jgi:hypothetical protein